MPDLETKIERIRHSKPGQRFGGFRSGFSDYADRIDFLNATLRVCPQFFESLRETVLPLFPTRIPYGAIRGGDYHRSALAAIHEAFEVWITRFSIPSVTWLHRVALETLRQWKAQPELKGFAFNASAEFTREDRFEFVRDRDLETLSDFLKRVDAEIRATYEEAAGAEKSPHSLNTEHAEWLALFQFAGLSPARIQRYEADRKHPRGRIARPSDNRGHDTDASIIRKGYTQAAEQLRIPLRKPKKSALLK
jgi:hypothetical protein